MINDIKYGSIVESMFPDGAELLSRADPPRRQQLRKIIAPSVGMTMIKRSSD